MLTMTRSEAENYLRPKIEEYLEKKGIDLNKPFRCLNPAHNDKKPSMSYNKSGNNVHCFSCNATYSLFDLIGLDYGLTNFSDIILKAGELFNIKIVNDADYQKPGADQRGQNKAEISRKETAIDFSLWPLASQNKTALDYLQNRGISKETADHFNLRYAPSLYFYEERGNSQAIVIPNSESSFNARNLNPSCKQRYSKKGSQRLFNIEALEKSEKPIFITEGEFDALSIIEKGGEAIALESISNLRALLLQAKQSQLKQPLIIAVDNDQAGQDALKSEELQKLIADLKAEGLNIYIPDLQKLYNGKKDANEALLENDFYFEMTINDIQEEALDQIRKQEELKSQEALNELKRDSVSNSLDAFNQIIEKSKTASFIPTGFNSLDSILDGGLYSGLYIVGAISSLGKTTLCLQIGDQIAKAGNDVLIFSLEMSKIELIAKSISRLTSIIDIEKTGSNSNAKTTRGILTGSKYQKYNPTELSIIQEAKETYFREYAPNLYIYEGMGNIGVNQIRKKVEAFKRIKGQAPIVIIDYIQILAPVENKYLSDKQVMDFNVMELKRISRDYETSIIGISSFNRDNYNAPVNMASFKESGAIEYSSDVLIGLQYKAMSQLKEDGKDKAKASEIFSNIAEKAKNREAIEIQLKILKNRNGTKGTIDLDFFPMFNKFKEPAVREWH